MTADPGALRVRELRLTNVPVATALKYICDSTRLKYKVDDFAVTLVPASDDGEDIVTRSFQVPPDFIDALSTGGGGAAEPAADPFATTAESGGGAGLKPRGNVQDLLKAKGVPFPEKASANFIPANSTLVVRNTPTNLDLIEQIVEAMVDETPKQIKIMTKFVEISQENNEELGFDWIVTPFGLGADLFAGGGTIGSGTPRNNSDFINPVNFTTIDGIPANPGQDVYNIVTGGNRSGSAAITRDSISSILNNPNRTAQSTSVAPGILNLTGLFSQGQVQMIMRGLSQKKGADVMTAPSIMAKSGQKATIEIIREFIYPTEYEPPNCHSRSVLPAVSVVVWVVSVAARVFSRDSRDSHGVRTTQHGCDLGNRADSRQQRFRDRPAFRSGNRRVRRLHQLWQPDSIAFLRCSG